MIKEPVTNIAIFASGAGTNAANIIHYFKQLRSVNVVLIVSNNINAGVLQIAFENNIPSLIIDKEKFFKGDGYLPELKNAAADFIVLAGFLMEDTGFNY